MKIVLIPPHMDQGNEGGRDGSQYQFLGTGGTARAASGPPHQEAATAAPPRPSFQRHANTGPQMNTSSNRAPPRRVDHTYRDYSSFPLGELPTGKKAPTNFPSKLHQILSTPEYSHPHGRAWKIHNKELLIRDVVPKYFVQSKYESFTRQLNGWGFKRLHQSGNDFNAYYNECFLRGLPHLVVLMKRVPPNQGKLLPHVEGEPNFYEIDKQFPLPPPMMPYPSGHYHYSPPHPAMAGAPGYGAMPAPPPQDEYHGSPSSHYSYPPGAYPPPPLYYGHHPAEPHAHQASGAAAYPTQQPPGYPAYPYFPGQYSQHQAPGHEHYPHYAYQPGPPYGPSASHYDNPPPPLGDVDPGPVKSEEVPSSTTSESITHAHGGQAAPVQEETMPIKNESTSYEPLNIFNESESNNNESSEGK